MDSSQSTPIFASHIDLFLRIYLLARKLKSLIKVQNADHFNDLVVLIFLRDQSASVSQLAERLHIKPSAMSQKIIRLEAEGLVKTIKSQDSREKIVKLTTTGQKHWQQVVNEIQSKCEMQYGPCLIESEVKMALGILNKINL